MQLLVGPALIAPNAWRSAGKKTAICDSGNVESSPSNTTSKRRVTHIYQSILSFCDSSQQIEIGSILSSTIEFSPGDISLARLRLCSEYDDELSPTNEAELRLS